MLKGPTSSDQIFTEHTFGYEHDNRLSTFIILHRETGGARGKTQRGLGWGGGLFQAKKKKVIVFSSLSSSQKGSDYTIKSSLCTEKRMKERETVEGNSDKQPAFRLKCIIGVPPIKMHKHT